MVFLLSLLSLTEPGHTDLYRPGLLLLPATAQQHIGLAYSGAPHYSGGTMYHAGMTGPRIWLSGQIGYHAFKNSAASTQLFQADVQIAYRYKKQPDYGALRTFWTAGIQVSSFTSQNEGLSLETWRISGNQYVPYLATGLTIRKGIFSMQLAAKGAMRRVWNAELKQLNPNYRFSDFGFTPGSWQARLAPTAALFAGRDRIQCFMSWGAQLSGSALRGGVTSLGILWRPVATRF